MKALMTSLLVWAASTTLATTALAQGEAPVPAPAPEEGAAPASAAAPEPGAAPAPAAALTPAAAPAAENAGASTSDAEGKFVLGLRLGFGLPLGDAAKDGPMSDYASGQIPIWVDAGYMVTRNIMVGLYCQFGIGLVSSKFKDNLPAGVSTSAYDLRFGAQAQYHVMPGQSMNPWFGLGFGYELGGVSASRGGVEESISGSGFEYVNLQGGLDFRVTSYLGIGPFVSFSLGEFGSYKISQTGSADQSGDISDTAMHEWLLLGVRGMFKL